MKDWLNKIHVGHCHELMREMIADGVKVNCIVSSPPYWGLRCYGHERQFGLERTWVRHVARMRYTFRLARELLADDGTLWLNYGDSYISWRANGGVGANSSINGQRGQEEFRKASRAMKSRISPPDVSGPNRQRQRGLKDKDLVGMPWRVALALQDDGWWLRSDIVWHKPNPMPESVRDRPTKTHEYVFMLAKSREYFFDQEAVLEEVSENTHARLSQDVEKQVGSERANGGVRPDRPMKAVSRKKKPVAGWDNRKAGAHSSIEHAAPGASDGTKFGRKLAPTGEGIKSNESFDEALALRVDKRNTRTVWKIPTEGFSAAHFATFPRELVRRCIFAGCPVGGTVFDPFMGSGTVAEVAQMYGRNFIGTELNPEYAKMFEEHRSPERGLAL